MGLRDRFTDLAASFIGGAADIASESLEKAAKINYKSSAMAPDTTQAALPPEPAVDDPRALLYDPFALIDQLGYRDRPSGLTYYTLREMAKRVPIYAAIEQTRINQVASFGHRQKDEREPGFRLQLRDEKATPTKQDIIRMRQLEDWMLQTGSKWAPGRDGFKTFLRKLVRDSLELDQGCFEIVRNRKGDPAEFYALDSATIRLADVPPGAESQQNPNQVKYVQVYDEIIISEFAAHEMCFGVRNPRSDIRVNGYGLSELELLINVVTALLWGFEYNKNFFKNGMAARGLINFKGSVPDKKIDGFRRQWQMMISGVSNAHKTPMVNVDEVQWIDMHQDNQKMGYADWMDWLTKITCAVLQFDPAEINFNYGNTGQSQQMFGTPVEQKLKHSKDRGLKPLLEDVASWINIHLIWPLDPYFEFAFLGLDAKSTDQAVELAKKQSEFLKTVDELRAEEDLDPLPDGAGEVILNPVWLQNKQAAQMAAQQEEMGGDYEEDQDEGEMGDVMNALPEQGNGNGANNDYDFDQVFGDQQKSMIITDDLQKSEKARIKVYEIEL